MTEIDDDVTDNSNIFNMEELIKIIYTKNTQKVLNYD